MQVAPRRETGGALCYEARMKVVIALIALVLLVVPMLAAIRRLRRLPRSGDAGPRPHDEEPD